MNFQEEKSKISPRLIIPFSSKVALCSQVAPGRSWVVLGHSGELDGKCPSGGGVPPVLSAQGQRCPFKHSPRHWAAFGGLSQGVSPLSQICPSRKVGMPTALNPCGRMESHICPKNCSPSPESRETNQDRRATSSPQRSTDRQQDGASQEPPPQSQPRAGETRPGFSGLNSSVGLN